MIRLAQVNDVDLLSDIERAADAVFRSVGMAAVAESETMPIADLLRYQQAGRVWVDADESNHPIAYILLDLLDGSAHIEQVSVHSSHSGQGKGRQLIETAAEWAKQQGYAMLTLTTFADVPWNAPYYARLGFEVVPPAQITPDLREIRRHEASAGLDVWPRVVMSRALQNQPNRLRGNGVPLWAPLQARSLDHVRKPIDLRDERPGPAGRRERQITPSMMRR